LLTIRTCAVVSSLYSLGDATKTTFSLFFENVFIFAASRRKSILKGFVDLERVISEFWSAAKEEMDFLLEAANMKTFYKKQ